MFAVITAAAAWLLTLPADQKSAENENRVLATMAPLNRETAFSGKFAEGFDDYLSDNIGYRSAFTDFTEWLNSVKGLKSPVGKIVFANSDHGTGTAQGANLLVTEDRVCEIFADSDAEQSYISVINRYAEKLDADINLYSMLIPTQLDFMEPIYANLQDSEKNAINRIYSSLDPRVKTVNVYDKIAEHTDEYIYFRTDHHWTPLGAYYGYQAFAEAAGLTPISKDLFQTYDINNFLGYLYRFAQEPKLEQNPDTITWYDTDPSGAISVSMRAIDETGNLIFYPGSLFVRDKSDYGIFFGGDHQFILLENSAETSGRTLVVIKDSYANAFVPLVVNNYSRVIMIDPRGYKVNLQSVIDEFRPDDFMILDYVFATAMDGFDDALNELY